MRRAFGTKSVSSEDKKSTKTKTLISSSATFFATRARRVEGPRECQVKRQKPKTDKKTILQKCNFFAGCPNVSRAEGPQVGRRVLSRGKTVKSQIEEGIYSLKSAFQKQTNSA